GDQRRWQILVEPHLVAELGRQRGVADEHELLGEHPDLEDGTESTADPRDVRQWRAGPRVERVECDRATARTMRGVLATPVVLDLEDAHSPDLPASRPTIRW